MKFDFSQMHNLDHRIGDQRCRASFGGWRRHLFVAWHFGPMRSDFDAWWRTFSRACRRGKHDVYYVYDRVDGHATIRVGCTGCAWTRLPSEHEIDEAHRWRGGP